MDPKRPLFPIYDIMEHWAAFAHSNPDVKCQHHALYLALVNLCKVKGGSSRFALAYQHGMDISGIGSRNTYAAVLKELQAWGFVTHTPGANGYKTPIIDVHFCASAEHQLSIYRASTSTPTDTSTGHNKEVISLRLEVVEVKATAAKLENEKSALQAELISLKAQLTPGALPALPAKTPKDLAALLTGDNDQFTADTVPMLNDPRLFGIVLARYGVGECDQAHYMREIRATCESKHMNAGVAQFESFIKSYFKNDAASRNGLVKPVATAQPMGQAANPMTFELNPAAAARRAAAEALNMQNIIAANLARINRKEGTNYTIGGMVGTVTPI